MVCCDSTSFKHVNGKKKNSRNEGEKSHLNKARKENYNKHMLKRKLVESQKNKKNNKKSLRSGTWFPPNTEFK